MMYPGITPEFEKAVEDLLEWLHTEITKTMPASGPSLPWFQHGLRGMWRKFMYGNSPDNPDWYHPEHGFIRRPTLQEYIEYREAAEKRLNAFLEEAGGKNPIIARILEQFKSRFLVLMSHYIVGGTTTGGDPDKIARAFAKELPQAVEILKNAGLDTTTIKTFGPAEMANELLKQNIDFLPHIKRAASDARYHDKLRELMLQQIGGDSD